MAPDVVLEVDHINPVKNGGDNNILNLVTSCMDCNRGKGARKLSEHDEIKKQQEQLRILNEKREQLAWMIEWKKELSHFEDEQIAAVENLFFSVTGDGFSPREKDAIRRELKKYGFDEVYQAAEISLNQYYDEDDVDSWSKAIAYVGRICHTRAEQKENPLLKDVNYLVKAAKNKFGYVDERKFRWYLNKYMTDDDIEEIKCLIWQSRSWYALSYDVEEYFGTSSELN